jgi:hypothetical protein
MDGCLAVDEQDWEIVRRSPLFERLTGQGQTKQVSGALQLLINIDWDLRFQPEGLGFDSRLGHTDHFSPITYRKMPY